MGRAARLAAIARLQPAAAALLLRGKWHLRRDDLPAALAAFRAAVVADSRAALIDWGLWPGDVPGPGADVRGLSLTRHAAWWGPGRARQAPLAARLQGKPALRRWAVAQGFALPPLLAQAAHPDALDWAALPADRLVIKPARGAARQGVVLLAGGIDRMTGQPVAPGPAALAAHVRARWAAQGCAGQPVLVEALLTDSEATARPDLLIPRDIKVYAVAGHPVAVLVHDRNGPRSPAQGQVRIACHDTAGRRLADIRAVGHDPRPLALPPGSAAVLAGAARASALLPQLMRFDFYATPAGPVLGEVTAWPCAGLGYTRYGARVMEQLWAAWPDQGANPAPPAAPPAA